MKWLELNMQKMETMDQMMETMASKEDIKDMKRVIMNSIMHIFTSNSYLQEEDKENKRVLSQSHIEKN